jgi:hypothetical protein
LLMNTTMARLLRIASAILAQQQRRHDGGEEAAGPQDDHVGLAQRLDRFARGGTTGFRLRARGGVVS